MTDTYDQQRYSRQILLEEIGKQGQERLRQSRVLVVGAGGLGSPVLTYLVGAGIGSIGIVDGDIVSLSNLPRQILYNEDDIGMPKAEIAQKRLQKSNTECNIKSYCTFLTQDNTLEISADYDIIVDCTDNFATRYLIDDTALHFGKTWVYGSVLCYKGQVSVFNGAKGQSYRRLFSEEDSSTPNAETQGVLGTLTGIIGCIQANEVIKTITNQPNRLENRLLIFDIQSYKQMVFDI